MPAPTAAVVVVNLSTLRAYSVDTRGIYRAGGLGFYRPMVASPQLAAVISLAVVQRSGKQTTDVFCSNAVFIFRVFSFLLVVRLFLFSIAELRTPRQCTRR